MTSDKAPVTGISPQPPMEEKPSLLARCRRRVFGPPRDLSDRRLFHNLSVMAFLAWVGLGADGLSSSCYGPEEAFRTLGDHRYLVLPLAALVMATVFIISACYSRIIERFPHGGGGYIVATALLGKRAGVLSGCALLVDYVLTITVSIVAAGDALFSLLPIEWQAYKLPVEAVLILGLTTINIRGVKESILMLMPVFILFLVLHVLLVVGGVFSGHGVVSTARESVQGFRSGLAALGAGGMVLLFFHAYSLGGGTYTGIEAVSNGIPIMREPRVQTARRTMVYMSVSLALTAGGLLLCYLLCGLRFEEGKTINAVLAERVIGGMPMGGALVALILVSEGALLVVAAQAGFVDGPRVLGNMAADSWFPRRFATLSDRLTTQNGILVMGVAALAALLYTKGDVRQLVVMYSINVFLTFSLSMLGMSGAIFRERKTHARWKRRLALFLVGLVFCVTILVITAVEKFTEGGWVTLVVTGAVVALCFLIRRHYAVVSAKLEELYRSLATIPRVQDRPCPPMDPGQPTAVILVGGYSGVGIHATLNAFRAFPDMFKNVVFLSAGVLDSSAFKGEDPLAIVRAGAEDALRKYVELAQGQGIPATYRMAVGTDAVEELEKLCLQAARDFPHVTFFAGQLVFQKERWYQPILHNETAYVLQKRLQWAGHTMVILPARVQ